MARTSSGVTWSRLFNQACAGNLVEGQRAAWVGIDVNPAPQVFNKLLWTMRRSDESNDVALDRFCILRELISSASTLSARQRCTSSWSAYQRCSPGGIRR